jgi:hypothetical protein
MPVRGWAADRLVVRRRPPAHRREPAAAAGPRDWRLRRHGAGGPSPDSPDSGAPAPAGQPAVSVARPKMAELVRSLPGILLPARGAYRDHHGGGLWLNDADGWFLVRNLAGTEWSARFCADPAKVDLLRVNAKRICERASRKRVTRWVSPSCWILRSPARRTWAAGPTASATPACRCRRDCTPAYAAGLRRPAPLPAPVAEIAVFKYDEFRCE